MGLSLLSFAVLAHSKSAPEYYHEGATNYVHGHWARAKTAVSNGLVLFPKDEKLLALNKLMEQPPQQQQQEQEKKDQQDKKDQQEQKDQQSKQNQQQQQQEQEKKDQPQQDQQKPPGKQEKEEQSQQQKAGGGDQKGDKEGVEGQAQPVQMTQEQAQRLLEAVKSEEKVMIFTPNFKNKRDNNRVLKDW